MTDDLRSTFFEVDDERHQRWLAAAEAAGQPLEVWIPLVLDAQAEIVLGHERSDPENGSA